MAVGVGVVLVGIASWFVFSGDGDGEEAAAITTTTAVTTTTIVDTATTTMPPTTTTVVTTTTVPATTTSSAASGVSYNAVRGSIGNAQSWSCDGSSLGSASTQDTDVVLIWPNIDDLPAPEPPGTVPVVTIVINTGPEVTVEYFYFTADASSDQQGYTSDPLIGGPCGDFGVRNSEPRRLEVGDDVIIGGNAPPPTEVDAGVSVYFADALDPGGAFFSQSDFIDAITAGSFDEFSLRQELELAPEGGLFSGYDGEAEETWNLIVFP